MYYYLHRSRLILTGCKTLPKIFLLQSYRSVWTRSILQIASCNFCFILPRYHSSLRPSPMELKDVLKVLEDLAPLSLAEPWDNVGLLVEPSEPRPVKTVLLTNDLTEAVMEEARAEGCNLIISYHPPLFRPIKRLVQKDWKQRLVIRAVEAGIAVFSPHTSWDNVGGGVNDWLVGGLGESMEKCSQLKWQRVGTICINVRVIRNLQTAAKAENMTHWHIFCLALFVV